MVGRVFGKTRLSAFYGLKMPFFARFSVFSTLIPRCAAAEGARRFDDDETMIARITPELRDIVLHPVHAPCSQAKHLNRGDNAKKFLAFSCCDARFRSFCMRG